MTTFAQTFKDPNDAIGILAMALAVDSKKAVDWEYLFTNFVTEIHEGEDILFVPEVHLDDMEDELFDPDVLERIFAA